ncbi:MAG: SMP-30/gluconolactonase/LRE family protein [Microlunatus sp.]|nr:SMP-30/gluconolactonase/LRE family protein [Microlunatus sp.]
MRADQFTKIVVGHGEGPVWWPPDGLRICDGYAGSVVSVDATGQVTDRLAVGSFLGAFRPRTTGGLVAATARSFVLVESDGTVRDQGELWADADIRMNDGGCDPEGRFYCGSMLDDASRPVGSLFRLDPDGTVDVLLTDLGCPNGLVFTGDTVYFIDTNEQRIDAFTRDHNGSWRDRHPVARDLGKGMPDGMTIDAEGRLWVAMWGGSCVRCIDPSTGATVEIVEVPDAYQTSACTFGGPDLDQLFITTSTARDQGGPLGGAVFVAEPGVRGLLPEPFRG